MQGSKVVVIGAGVIGLTTAVVLLRAGIEVEILTREVSSDTTSAAAAAFWYPFHAYPIDKVSKWSEASLSVFKELALVAEAGIVFDRMLEVSQAAATSVPWWATLVDNFCAAEIHEIPPGHVSGHWFDTPVIDTTIYLPYLIDCIFMLGGNIRISEVGNLEELSHANDGAVLINCTGIGARKLTGDNDLRAAKGQVLSIKRAAEHRLLNDPNGEIYFAHVIPRVNDTILGGIYLEHDDSLEVDPKQNLAIIERCLKIFPQLKINPETDILGAKVGFRPVRSEVRVEPEWITQERLVVHNYGHGGAGFTLSWGCAQDVLEIIRANGFQA